MPTTKGRLLKNGLNTRRGRNAIAPVHPGGVAQVFSAVSLPVGSNYITLKVS
jgi:hypothetical protein